MPNALVKTSQNIPDCTVAHMKRNLECVHRSRYLCRRKAFCKAYFWLLQRSENKSEYSYFGERWSEKINMLATIPKDNMGYDQYTAPDVL